jgi:hypothetical protein
MYNVRLYARERERERERMYLFRNKVQVLYDPDLQCVCVYVCVFACTRACVRACAYAISECALCGRQHRARAWVGAYNTFSLIVKERQETILDRTGYC